MAVQCTHCGRGRQTVAHVSVVMAKAGRVEGVDVPVAVHGGAGVQHLLLPVVKGLLLDFKNFFLASHLRGILNVSLGPTLREGGSNSS